MVHLTPSFSLFLPPGMPPVPCTAALSLARTLSLASIETLQHSKYQGMKKVEQSWEIQAAQR